MNEEKSNESATQHSYYGLQQARFQSYFNFIAAYNVN